MSTICMDLLEMKDTTIKDDVLDPMECICGDIASPSHVDITYNFDGKSIVVKNVPVLRCDNCSEIYNDTLIELRVEKLADKAHRKNRSVIEFSESL